MTAERAILHVDMDAFYAAIEQRDRPELRGKPVVVGTLAPRSVVSTCSYEARPFGVRSAMPTMTAQRLCPDAIFVTPRMAVYQEVSREVFAVFAEVTPQIEGLSLDEAFLDVTASLRLFGGRIETIGRHVKQGVRARTGLNASVGMAHNKLIAKLASELSKPDGLLRVQVHQVQATLDPLPVARLWTVGKVAESALHRLGLRTVGELRRADPARLVRALGNHATQLQALARGEDRRPVQSDVEERSISAETTFDTDLKTLDQAQDWVARLAERVGERVRAQGLKGITVTLKVRKPPFETHTRQQRLGGHSDTTVDIADCARRLLQAWWEAEKRPQLRLLGVGMSGFGEDSQSDLFEKSEARRRDALADAINRRYGGGTLTRAAVLRTRRGSDDEASS
jgi:DNA polymerase-4